MENAAPLKLVAGEWHHQTPVRYPNVYAVEQTTGPERLIVGPVGNHVEVLLSMAELWQREYYLLYVLLVPRLGKRAPGRYQSPCPLSFEQVSTFCRRFSSFLQGDARHHLWIGSTESAGLLIYDQHELIWAYGNIPTYINVLQSRGFSEGEVILPAPHSHSYNEVFDVAEDELVGYWDWLYSPLQPGDDY